MYSPQQSPKSRRLIATLGVAAAAYAVTPTAVAVTPSGTTGVTPTGLPALTGPVLPGLPAVRAPGLPDTPLLRPPQNKRGDHLTVSVKESGDKAYDGTKYELSCHPTGGDHPHAEEACAKLDQATRRDTDAFAPVGADENCTMQYGGPATARVTGNWGGRPVDATFSRDNGCEIDRWNRFEPLLPGTA